MGMLQRRRGSGGHRTGGAPTSGAGGPGLVGVVELNQANMPPGVNSTVTTPAFVPAVGELLVVKATSNNYPVTPSSISGGGLTWTKRATAGINGSTSPVAIWTAAVGMSASMTVSVVFASTSTGYGLGEVVVERYTGATLGSPVNVVTVDSDTATPFQGTLTTTAANAVVSWIEADYNGVSGTVTYVGGPTQTQRLQVVPAGTLSVSTAFQTAPTVGAQTFGLSAPAGQVATLAALELVPGTPDTTPTAPVTPVTLDASTPALVRRAYGTGTTATSASFTPPVGSLQVALVNVGWGVTPTGTPGLSMTDSVGGTWSQMGIVTGDGTQSAIFVSPVTAATPRTVAATSASNTGKSMQLAVRVYTGAQTPAPGAGVWTSTTSMTVTVTTTVPGARVVVAGSSGTNNAGGINPTTNTTSLDVWSDPGAGGSGDDIALGVSSASTGTPNTTAFGWSPAGRVVALEVVPTSGSSGGGGSPPSSAFELGINGWIDQQSATTCGNGNLGAAVMRAEFTVDQLTLATQVADWCNAANIRLQPLIGWDDGVAAPDLTGLGTWASTLGPGGSHWNGTSPVAAVTRIELGNENSYFYKSGLPGDAGYQSLATTYGQRALAAAQAINTANSAVKVLVELEGADSNVSTWVDKVLGAGGTTLINLMGGPVIHLYGPDWQNKLNLNWGFLTSWGVTKPYYVTETGIASDNGNTLTDNYGWPVNLTYTQAANDHLTVIEGMAALTTQIKQACIYQMHDTADTGTSNNREDFFGVLAAAFGDKGAISTTARNEFATHRG